MKLQIAVSRNKALRTKKKLVQSQRGGSFWSAIAKVALPILGGIGGSKKKKKEERDIEATITCCCQQQGVGRQSFGGARSRTHIPHPFARTMASLNTLFGVDMMLREDIY